MTHQVYLADRPVSFAVEDGETVLAAGLRQHLALPFGCQSGGCGSCRVRLTAGAVAYPFAPPALSQAEIDAGYILMCLARSQSDLTLELHQPPQLDELRPRKLPSRVLSKRMLSHDVIELRLKLPKGDALRYLPGQYLDILLDDGRRRSFSIANAPNGETLELHLRVAPGGKFARWVLDEMPDKAILRLEAPLGAFYIREDSSRPILIMAGGTGFSPAKAMLEDLLPRAAQRRVHLFWGGRAQADLYLDAEVRAWAARYPQFRYSPVLAEPDAGWAGEAGFVHEALLRAYPSLSGYEVYLCGPPAMVQAGKRAFLAAGLDADHLFYDSFDYAFETWPQLG
ncbi:MAG: 2Fe-2S iron-sulfur cluster binding domain-containing protein [Nevskiaceae bacterium]|nr:MAG: 2Fe-2S iron-sulfur cluster binding domain-containing protein [Nevskiaceae bacterium]